MAYIGNTVENQGFTPAIDYFNGDGVTVTFTLSRPIASVAQVIVAIDNVIQNPSSSYTVAGSAITFSSAPLSGTNNIWVEYTSLITTYNAISQDPTVIGDIRATGGYLAEGDFGNSFVDGTILDYVTGNGRVTVGSLDDITFYHGGTAGRSEIMKLSYAGNSTLTGNLSVSGSLITPTMTSPTISSGALTIGTTKLGAGDSSSFKNRIINGAMVIDQRNAGASVTPTDSSYTLDRWFVRCSQASKFTIQQNAGSVTPPVGFSKYLGVTSTSAYSVASGDFFFNAQAIEGYNIADLGFGTASAKTITISFQVYSSLTGTFGGTLRNGANNRYCPFSYTVSSANTWTSISVTIAGDTTGTWATDNTAGLYLYFNLGTGSTYSGGTSGVWGSTAYFTPAGTVSVVGTNGATFYITGVQLEVGSTATSFDYLDYGRSLIQCQRYYWKTTGTSGSGYAAVAAGGFINTTNFSSFIPYPVQMRATPTFSISSDLYIAITGFPSVTAIGGNYANQYSARVEFTTTTSVAGYGGSVALDNKVTSFIDASAEL